MRLRAYDYIAMIILALITLALFTGCGPSQKTTTEMKEVNRSGWAQYDSLLKIDSKGKMNPLHWQDLVLLGPAFGIWESEDRKLTLYRDSTVIRDSTRLHDSTIYTWRYRYRDSLRIRDSIRWHDKYRWLDTTNEVTYDKTWYEKLSIKLFPVMVLLAIVLAGVIFVRK